MARIFDPEGPFSQLAINNDLSNWSALIHHLRFLPYGRTSDRSRLELVLTENRGTCSSKHALAYAICQEQGWDEWQLILGMYRMNEQNTPGVGPVLATTLLTYIPEAHCYLARGAERLDITKPNSDFAQLAADILVEIPIEANQVGEWKVNFHREYLRKWKEQQTALSMSFVEVWNVREACIAALT